MLTGLAPVALVATGDEESPWDPTEKTWIEPGLLPSPVRMPPAKAEVLLLPLFRTKA
jgi:hypothetical protein